MSKPYLSNEDVLGLFLAILHDDFPWEKSISGKLEFAEQICSRLCKFYGFEDIYKPINHRETERADDEVSPLSGYLALDKGTGDLPGDRL